MKSCSHRGSKTGVMEGAVTQKVAGARWQPKSLLMKPSSQRGCRAAGWGLQSQVGSSQALINSAVPAGLKGCSCCGCRNKSFNGGWFGYLVAREVSSQKPALAKKLNIDLNWTLLGVTLDKGGLEMLNPVDVVRLLWSSYVSTLISGTGPTERQSD